MNTFEKVLSTFNEEAAQLFFEEHKNESADSLVLKYNNKVSFDVKVIAEQVKLYKKAMSKVPSFTQKKALFNTKTIEQCTNEVVATYKANLFHGNKFIDLTTGLGVDSYFLSRSFKSGVCVEFDEENNALLKHNFLKLGVSNCDIIQTSAEELINNWTEKVDFIYADPDRRPVKNQKVFSPEDSLPNLVPFYEKLKQSTHCLAIKFSPMANLNEIENYFPEKPNSILFISQKSEMKEILAIYFQTDFGRMAVDLSENNYEYKVGTEQESFVKIEESNPSFIHLPKVCLAKSQLADNAASDLELLKYSNFQVYSSAFPIQNNGFRSYEIIEELPLKLNKTTKILKEKGISHCNMIIRGMQYDADKLLQEMKLKPGGDFYLIYVKTLTTGDKLMLCKML